MKLHHFSVHDIPRRRFIELTMKGGLAVAATPTFRVAEMQIGSR